jgi:peptide/nickel transport system permease protein
MAHLLARRIAGLLVTMAVASVLVFAMIQILPGDPAELMLGADARPDTLMVLRHEMGLDRPWLIQYTDWAGGLLQGDFGLSHTYHVPVISLILERLPVSLPLAIASLVLAMILGITSGIIAAARHGSWLDHAIRLKTQLVLALPNFWLAMLLVFVFAISWHWFPAGGFAGWNGGIGSARALVLPAIALALPQAAILSRVMRQALLETVEDPYVLAARSRGLSRAAALIAHALPNAFLPVLSVLGLQFSFLLAGTIIIENVFYLPGLGRLIFQAVNQRDLPVIMGSSMVLIASVMIVSFVVDLIAQTLDPRLRRRS